MKYVAAVLALVLFACEARASQQYWPAGAFDTVPTNSCTPVDSAGANHNYRSMSCDYTGTQKFTIHTWIPEDYGFGDNVSAKVFWRANTSSTNKACWKISITGCYSGLALLGGGMYQACNWNDLTLWSAVSMGPVANVGINKLNVTSEDDVTTQVVASPTYGVICSAASAPPIFNRYCKNVPAVVLVERDNSGSCVNNLQTSVEVEGVELGF